MTGVALTLVAFLPLIVMTDGRRGIQNSRRKIYSALTLSIIFVTIMALAVFSVRNTTYMTQLLESWDIL